MLRILSLLAGAGYLSVQFRKSHGGLELARRRLEMRCHGDTRAAPRGPEIHHQGQVVALEMPGEARFGEVPGLACEQGGVAFGAVRGLAETGRGQAHHGITMAANDMQCIVRGGAHEQLRGVPQ